MFDRHARLALVVATVTLAVSGVGFRFAAHAVHAYLAKKPVPLRSPLTGIPKNLGTWQATGRDLRLTAELEEALGTPFYLDRTYVRGDGDDAVRVGVHIPYYTGLIDAVPHVPDRCLQAGGWVNVTLPSNLDLPLDRSRWELDPRRTTLDGEPYPLVTFTRYVSGSRMTVRMPIGTFKLRTTEFRDARRPEVRIFAGYFFIANGRTTPIPEGVRRFAFNLKTKYAYYAKIQFTMSVSESTSEDEFAAIVASLADELLPELMLCLPDWSDVETEARAG